MLSQEDLLLIADLVLTYFSWRKLQLKLLMWEIWMFLKMGGKVSNDFVFSEGLFI